MEKEINIDQADNEVVQALFKAAVNGNVNAQIFWLCNRKPAEWSKNGRTTEESNNECGVVLIPARISEERTVSK